MERIRTKEPFGSLQTIVGPMVASTFRHKLPIEVLPLLPPIVMPMRFIDVVPAVPSIVVPMVRILLVLMVPVTDSTKVR